MSKATGTVAYLLCCLFKSNIREKSILYCSRSILNEKRYKIRYTVVELQKWNLDLGPCSAQLGSWTTTTDGLTLMTQQIAFQKARFCENINPGLPQSWIARSMIDWSGIGSIHLSEMKCFLSLQCLTFIWC